MTSLPFQFLNSVLLWTSELAWACGHWHNNFTVICVLFWVFPFRSLPYREIFPGFAHVPNTISRVTWLEILGQQQNFYTPYVSTPFSPFLGFLTGPSFILSSFLALKAYLLSKVAMVQPATKAPWVRPSRSVWTKTLGSQHTSRAWTSALMMQVGIDL